MNHSMSNKNFGLIIPVVYGNMDLFLQGLLDASCHAKQLHSVFSMIIQI